MTADQLTLYVLFPLAGYLLGSIPFAWIIGKAHGVDIRTVGSKNIGATNLGRTLGKKYFWYAFLLDAGKGFLPVLLVSVLVHHWNMILASMPLQDDHTIPMGGPGTYVPAHPALIPLWIPLLTAIACVLGHTLPVFLKFQGGKGVATSFGVVLGFWPLYTLAGIGGGIVFLLVLFAYRYISLASMIGVSAFSVLVMLLGSSHFDGGPIHFPLPWSQLQPVVIVAWLFTALIVFRHRANISRLLKGTEPKVGQREINKAKLQK